MKYSQRTYDLAREIIVKVERNKSKYDQNVVERLHVQLKQFEVLVEDFRGTVLDENVLFELQDVMERLMGTLGELSAIVSSEPVMRKNDG